MDEYRDETVIPKAPPLPKPSDVLAPPPPPPPPLFGDFKRFSVSFLLSIWVEILILGWIYAQAGAAYESVQSNSRLCDRYAVTERGDVSRAATVRSCGCSTL